MGKQQRQMLERVWKIAGDFGFVYEVRTSENSDEFTDIVCLEGVNPGYPPITASADQLEALRDALTERLDILRRK